MIEIYEKWFAGYTAGVRSRISCDSFEFADERQANLEEVDLKIEHSYRVRDRALEIAKSEKLGERDLELAAIIGLFHDLGRFQQALNFGTMDDRITGLHGELSADVFMESAPKENFSPQEVEVIADSLRCHNLFKVPDGLNGRSLFFTRLIRDADKLDIFQFYSEIARDKGNQARGFRFIMSTESAIKGECTPELLAGVLRGENLNVGSIRNSNDRKLVQLSMVFNLNFTYSYQWLLEKGYLADIIGTGSKDLMRAYEYVVEWMKSMMKI